MSASGGHVDRKLRANAGREPSLSDNLWSSLARCQDFLRPDTWAVVRRTIWIFFLIPFIPFKGGTIELTNCCRWSLLVNFVSSEETRSCGDRF